ncbi:MAG: tRNA (adenosine(37)-N6)-threonylcarbamoyltransferase complex transferase subunit TsaD [Candidatus Nealsonbacteria bacterium]
MKILAIETSCDDTGIAILEAKDKKLKVLSNVLSSQVKLHAKYGGVYPSLAKREHEKNLPVVFNKAMKQAKNPKIDAVAVTEGPGLEPCLWVGINFAKDLANKLRVPLIPVNHIEAHIISNFIEKIQKNIFPAMALIVSGGHTQLILMKGFSDYKILGETRDDAAGECFDKSARILGLGYPGGPEVAQRAKNKKIFPVTLPRPMINQKNYDFSFSGLKTAVLYNFQGQPKKIRKSKKYIDSMCSELQQAVIDVLLKKTKKAKQDYRAKTVMLGGGVSANEELRKQFKKEFNALVPDKKYSTDNAVMIGAAAYFNISRNKKHRKIIEARADLRL